VIICDTGALVALLNAADDYHAACSNLFATYPGRLIVPGPILTEVCYMAESRLGSETEALGFRTAACTLLTVTGAPGAT
jgi:predicted nucleic acid-binding protein